MISLSMIVKNEENNLHDCLKSVEGVVDEIVVIDTGSSDNTIAIAEEFNSKVYHFDWISDFAAARNFALSKCSGDYILYLDADERLTEKSAGLLTKLSESGSKAAYDCKILNVDEVNKRPSVMTYVRLFPRKEGVEFSGKVHEQIEKSLRENKVEIRRSDIEIIHTGYSRSKEDLKIKAKRNLAILLDEFENSNSSYYAFHIGQTYNILEDKIKARDYFELAVQDPGLKKEYKSTALRVLAVYLSEENNLEDALTHINNAIYSDGDQPLNFMVAAQLYGRSGNKEKELLFIVKALIVNRNFSNSDYKSSQNIFIDEYLIICTGLKAALESGDNDRFKYFKKELQSLSTDNPEKNDEINFITELINGDFTNANKNNLEKYTNDSNLELILELIPRQNDNSIISRAFNNICEVYPDNSEVVKNYAIYNLKTGDLDKSEEYLERTIELNTSDPAVYFYLISVYLQKNKLEKLPQMLNLVVERFGDNPAVLAQLNKLQQKLSELV